MQPSQQSSKQSPARPTGVTVVGVIAILGGIFGLLGALPILVGTPTMTEMILASTVVIFSIIAFGIGGGLLSGRSWAWMVAIAFYAISIPLGLAETVAGGSTGLLGGAIRTVVSIAFLYYLMKPRVKSFFGRP